jgi:hypothetical protein
MSHFQLKYERSVIAKTTKYCAQSTFTVVSAVVSFA